MSEDSFKHVGVGKCHEQNWLQNKNQGKAGIQTLAVSQEEHSRQWLCFSGAWACQEYTLETTRKSMWFPCSEEDSSNERCTATEASVISSSILNS